MPTVLLIGTLDTKGAEYAYVRERLRQRGVRTLVMDLGVLGEPPFAAGHPGGGRGPRRRRRSRRAARRAAIAARPSTPCCAAPARWCRRCTRDGRFDGVLGLGGGGGTAMITAAMRTLPVGVPKLMVSTMASGNTAPYVDVKDITLMSSVVDIAGLNPLSRRILANAAGAICRHGRPGASESRRDDPPRPLLAATMFGVTTPCVTAARQQLEAAGYDVLVFHATGTGGRAMEVARRQRLLPGRARRHDHRVVRRGGRRRPDAPGPIATAPPPGGRSRRSSRPAPSTW